MKNLPILQRLSSALSPRKAIKGAQSRSAKLREELAEAESVEDLIERLFADNLEILDEVEKAAVTMQRAITKMRNLAKARKAELEALLSEE